jgi:hypothetical protein
VRVNVVCDGAEPKPTRKGVCLNVAKLDLLLAAIEDARAKAVRLGWLMPPEEAACCNPEGERCEVHEPAPERGRLTDAEKARRYRERKRHSETVTNVTNSTNGRHGGRGLR